jgi:hypothetical protein
MARFQAFTAGPFPSTPFQTVRAVFPHTADWGTGLDAGAAVYIFDVGSGSIFTFNPGILVAGLGLGLRGQSDAPLVNTSVVRLGGVRLYSFVQAEFGNGFTFDLPGGGVELESLGIPLGRLPI